MIVVPVKEGENIEKALKKFKRKFEKTGVVKEFETQTAVRQTVCIEEIEDGTCYLRSKNASDRRIIPQKSLNN